MSYAERFLSGFIAITDQNGKTVTWTGLTNAEFATDSDGAYKKPDNADEIYARIPKSQEFHATGTLLMTRFNEYVLFYGVPGNRRMVRRAIRWEEKLRRWGYPKARRKLWAAKCALHASNNGKKGNQPKDLGWGFVIKEG